ncbi:hypothetical protein [Actinoplanes subglobosus]|uniref:Uncharacterized protein n=1 Tax=Actinoplanes subglobosus TaxID=1547892 RepID=A0ABV8J3B9_9ACTN
MSNLPNQPGSGGSGDGIVNIAFAAFAGSAAGEIGILTAGDVHAPATIVALAVFGVLGIGALIVATIAIRRR